MSGTTKTFYFPVGGNVSLEEAKDLARKFRKDPDGVIRLKSEPKPKK